MPKFEGVFSKTIWVLFAFGAVMLGVSISARIAEHQDRIVAAQEREIQKQLDVRGCGKDTRAKNRRFMTVTQDGDCRVLEDSLRRSRHYP